MITSKFVKQLSLVAMFLFAIGIQQTTAQGSVSGGDLNNLTDSELLEYWEQLHAQGYTIDQVKAVARARGISPQQIAALEERLMLLDGQAASDVYDTTSNPLTLSTPATATANTWGRAVVKDSLFGFDFFANDNISFAPNQNLATPESYVLGPGDELVISVWGAAESNYLVEVDREGALRIPNIGPIYVSGMAIKDAKLKIRSALKRVYAGLTAPASSPYRVNLDIAISNVRTVQVNIIGEVKVPGSYSLSALSTVLNALYASGGPTREGTFRNIKLVRNGEDVAVFDVYQYLVRGAQDGNLTLRDGDVLLVGPYETRVTVSGPVKRPGIYELKENETFADLFVYTSGFKSNAYRDLIVLERIENDRRRVVEIPLAEMKSAQPKDGDRIRVQGIIDKFENAVSIEGAVYRPGTYEFQNGLTLKGLIDKASGVNETAFMQRGILISTTDGVKKTSRSFSVAEVINGQNDISLQPNDEVRIYNKYSLTEEQTLTIDGAVNNPDSYPYIENLTVEDLILIAGGLRAGANPMVIDVYRRINDDSFETLTESFSVSADETLSQSTGGFVLQPFDRVAVRYMQGYGDYKTVQIGGEVIRPGSYSLAQKDERISDLVDRSGGVSPYAFVEGAYMIRKNPYYNEEIQNSVRVDLQDSTATNLDLRNRSEFKVGIDLQKILSTDGRGSKYDLILENGDELFIPSTKQTIKVEGEVLSPSMVRFDENFTLLDYINRSGGFSTNAKQGKVYVVYANGDIASTKRFLFFRSFPKLKPGAIILVPAKPDRRPLTVQEGVGITTGLVTVGLLIDRLIR
ncbi:SLBB domain-containing protein [Gilvibacter sp.]|uniref:SLBB domain-containing protein n=1 Tax=Gilvibacter sp. TaxID=2729997 RepID=UPI0025B9084A|nr:SLBB domain-containing protein [Gilvibacter sp.]NQX76895.1 SLBB domain-containing protein [Gilvibacter sp.]